MCAQQKRNLDVSLPTIHSALVFVSICLRQDLKLAALTDLKLVVLLLPQPAESYDYMYEQPRHLYSTVLISWMYDLTLEVNDYSVL